MLLTESLVRNVNNHFKTVIPFVPNNPGLSQQFFSYAYNVYKNKEEMKKHFKQMYNIYKQDTDLGPFYIILDFDIPPSKELLQKTKKITFEEYIKTQHFNLFETDGYLVFFFRDDYSYPNHAPSFVEDPRELDVLEQYQLEYINDPVFFETLREIPNYMIEEPEFRFGLKNATKAFIPEPVIPSDKEIIHKMYKSAFAVYHNFEDFWEFHDPSQNNFARISDGFFVVFEYDSLPYYTKKEYSRYKTLLKKQYPSKAEELIKELDRFYN